MTVRQSEFHECGRPATAIATVIPSIETIETRALAEELARRLGTPDSGDEWLDTRAVALRTRMSVSWLNHARQVPGLGPAFYRMGTRRVRYRRSDVEAWKSARRRDDCSDLRRER